MKMLFELNPWWINEIDKDLEYYKKLKHKIVPNWIKDISLAPFSLNFLLGPRRIGKTLGIKILIRELLKNRNPYSIFYFSCDVLEDYKELIEIIKEYKRLAKEKKIKTSFIFLDEITLVKDWWKAIKFFIDRKYFEKDVVTLLSSTSILLNQYFETFAGRMGKGKKIFIYPLNFKDYYFLFHNEFHKELAKEVFKDYLKTGGFLSFLNKEVDYKDYVSIIKADLMRIERSTQIAKEIFKILLKIAPNPASFNSIASELSLSVNTVKDYLEVFQNLFLIRQSLFIGLDKKVNLRKERKYFFVDPFLAHSIAFWTNSDLKEEVLLEWVVQEHVYRKYNEVYYYKNSYEIDVVVKDLKIEIKRTKLPRKKRILFLNKEKIPEFLFNFH